MKPKIILDPSFRRMDNIFSAGDLQRVNAAAEVIWGKDGAMPERARPIFHATGETGDNTTLGQQFGDQVRYIGFVGRIKTKRLDG